MERLGPAGRALLELVRRRGSVRTDDPAVAAAVRPDRATSVVADLERRLLIVAHQVHTETGAHAKVLEDWHRWGRRFRVEPFPQGAGARAELDRVVSDLNRRFSGSGRLPWWE
jgi:hypothetical protein